MPYRKPRMKDMEEDEPKDDWTIGQIRQCIGHERGTTIAELTSEFQRKGQRRVQRTRLRKRSKRRVQRRGLKKEVTEVKKRGREEVKKEIPADDGGGQNPEHVRDLYGWQTTRRRVVSKGTVRFCMADGRSMKVTGVRHVSLRCKIRSDEALKLVDEHSEFSRKTGDVAGKRRLMAISIGGKMSRQEELQSDISPVILDPEWYKSAKKYFEKCAEVWPDKSDATSAGCLWKSSEERDRVDERWSHDDLQSNVLCSAPRWGRAGHLSEKVQVLQFGSAFTSVEVELPVEEGQRVSDYVLHILQGSWTRRCKCLTHPSRKMGDTSMTRDRRRWRRGRRPAHLVHVEASSLVSRLEVDKAKGFEVDKPLQALKIVYGLGRGSLGDTLGSPFPSLEGSFDKPLALASKPHASFVPGKARLKIPLEGGEESRARSLGDSKSSREISCKLGSWRGDARGGEPSSKFRLPKLSLQAQQT
ncbi:hypothetical protein Acr_04g0005160 [Actinidia rufa]|uniref:Uncharacterized protein n=1 Tax=Actinidia rufa TaxID=165716 RepID=A0A7J0EH23_9ERIC|nr:hypothetical protein Acr_04g0005160 [Actinidia rufa]